MNDEWVDYCYGCNADGRLFINGHCSVCSWGEKELSGFERNIVNSPGRIVEECAEMTERQLDNYRAIVGEKIWYHGPHLTEEEKRYVLSLGKLVLKDEWQLERLRKWFETLHSIKQCCYCRKFYKTPEYARDCELEHRSRIKIGIRIDAESSPQTKRTTQVKIG